MSNYHVMLDLETMDHRPTSAIASIGAVIFDQKRIHRSYYKIIDLQSCFDIGLTVKASTIYWWLTRSQDARYELAKGSKLPIQDVLKSLANFVVQAGSPKIWGLGAAFDNVILSNAYDKAGLDRPWKFSDDRCFRTVRTQYSNTPPDKFEGVYHQAIDDAMNQAKHLMKIWNIHGYFE